MKKKVKLPADTSTETVPAHQSIKKRKTKKHISSQKILSFLNLVISLKLKHKVDFLKISL